MGRGRAKAKQQKVARDLKYNTRPTDFTALQRELGASGDPHDSQLDVDEGDGDQDEWAGDDEEDDWASASR